MNENINTFMHCARMLNSDSIKINSDSDRAGLDVNRYFLRNQTFFNNILTVATTYLGSDLKGIDINEDKSIRNFIMTNFDEFTDIFISDTGVFNIGLEQAIILHHKMKAERPDKVNLSTGILFLIAYKELKAEFECLFKAAIKDKVAPNYELNKQFFNWKRAPEVLKKYSLYVSKPEGYKCYYFEKNNLAQIVFLHMCGMNLLDATKFMDKRKNGILYSFLPKDVENRLMSVSLSGLTGGMDGEYASQLKKYQEDVYNKYTSDLYTTYSMYVKPIMIDILGACINEVMSDWDKSNLDYWDAFVYHLSPYRFGVAIKEDLDINEIMPNTVKSFKEVRKPLYTDVVNGLYL